LNAPFLNIDNPAPVALVKTALIMEGVLLLIAAPGGFQQNTGV